MSLRMQIPLGYFLPVKIVSNEKEFAIVFVVKEWWRNNQAVVECFAAEPVAVGRNARLIHQDAESSSILGTLVEYVR